MNNILIAGLINIETTLKINEFPVKYSPVDYKFFGIESSVSGVGYNVAKASKKLGAQPKLFSLIGNDMHKNLIISEIEKESIETSCVLPILKETPQSVILYDSEGKRKINLDLKDIQDTAYPMDNLDYIFSGVDLAAVCNINFARGLLPEAKKRGIPVATDIHVVDDVSDDYNKDFMKYADILFLSNEKIIGREKDFVSKLINTYNNKIIVVGMGDKGALIYVKDYDEMKMFPAVHTRKVVSTIGAGDSLFSAFIYFYCKNHDPYEALKNATVFASYKIGEKGAASGFLSEKQLCELKEKMKI